MKLTDFDALTFDCYGTLIDWETGIADWLLPWAARASQTAGQTAGQMINKEALLDAFADLETGVQAAAPTLPYPQVLGRVLDGLGARLGLDVRDSDRAEFGASIAAWPAFGDSAEALAYLADHYRLAIVSNVDRESFAATSERLGAAFDFVVTAQDVGAYKPARAHFDRALELLATVGVPRERVLHTAQSLYHDHVPAQALGLRTMWIDRRGPRGGGATPAPEQPVTPDFHVDSMAAFVALHRAHLAT